MTTLDTGGFVRNIFTVQLSTTTPDGSGDFASYAQIIGYNTLNDDPGIGGAGAVGQFGAPAHDAALTAILTDIGAAGGVLPQYFTKGKCRDTSIGGNDAINCYPQFNETDDVSSHPYLSTTPGNPLSGMGRVYSEVYDDQQQVMYISFGVPQYNSLTNFYTNAILPDLAKIMNSGLNHPGSALGALIGTVVGTVVTLPALPLAFIYNIISTVDSVKITKYYDFQSAMPLYYRCVNSMILHLSVNLGLYLDTTIINPTGSQVAGGNISNLTPGEQIAESTTTNAGVSTQGLPDLFKNSPDIYKIMLKKYQYIEGGLGGTIQSSDDALLNSGQGNAVVDVSGSGTFAHQFITAFEGTMYDAALFVGFRVEKGVDTSESFSNETGPSTIAGQVNSKAEQARDARFSTAYGNVDGGAGSAFLSAIGAVLKGAADTVVGSSVENILAGAGVVDFPDVWKSSSFSKSYHFNMSLRSPYGDQYSILQNLYIPLALLLGGALPRGIGQAAYTAPFVCRAYCKGMFAVPLGMITNMTVKRGADQFGWTSARLPTCLDVSFEIKDLSPAMYLAIADGGTWSALKEAFGANSNFQEYLMTLSGMGLADRTTWIRNIYRKAQYLLGQVQQSKVSPFYWGQALGQTLPARMLSRLLPNTRLPQ